MSGYDLYISGRYIAGSYEAKLAAAVVRSENADRVYLQLFPDHFVLYPVYVCRCGDCGHKVEAMIVSGPQPSHCHHCNSRAIDIQCVRTEKRISAEKQMKNKSTGEFYRLLDEFSGDVRVVPEIEDEP